MAITRWARRRRAVLKGLNTKRRKAGRPELKRLPEKKRKGGLPRPGSALLVSVASLTPESESPAAAGGAPGESGEDQEEGAPVGIGTADESEGV